MAMSVVEDAACIKPCCDICLRPAADTPPPDAKTLLVCYETKAEKSVLVRL